MTFKWHTFVFGWLPWITCALLMVFWVILMLHPGFDNDHDTARCKSRLAQAATNALDLQIELGECRIAKQTAQQPPIYTDVECGEMLNLCLDTLAKNQ